VTIAIQCFALGQAGAVRKIMDFQIQRDFHKNYTTKTSNMRHFGVKQGPKPLYDANVPEIGKIMRFTMVHQSLYRIGPALVPFK
jgi:hypothetical protein